MNIHGNKSKSLSPHLAPYLALGCLFGGVAALCLSGLFSEAGIAGLVLISGFFFFGAGLAAGYQLSAAARAENHKEPAVDPANQNHSQNQAPILFSVPGGGAFDSIKIFGIDIPESTKIQIRKRS